MNFMYWPIYSWSEMRKIIILITQTRKQAQSYNN